MSFMYLVRSTLLERGVSVLFKLSLIAYIHVFSQSIASALSSNTFTGTGYGVIL